MVLKNELYRLQLHHLPSTAIPIITGAHENVEIPLVELPTLPNSAHHTRGIGVQYLDMKLMYITTTLATGLGTVEMDMV